MKRLSSSGLFASLVIFIFYCDDAFAQVKTNDGWKAGVATVIITPENPLWMAGYANRDHPSEGKIVDLWAKALALEDATGKKAVLITADLVGIPKAVSDQVRDQLQKKFNLSRSQIAINTSHTHTGPVLTDALTAIYPVNERQQKDIDTYTNQLGQKLVTLAEKALRSMEPAQLYSGSGVTRFQVNRRNNPESTLALQSDLNGPNDYAVPVIRIENGSGKLLAIAFGYACHNTVLAGYKWSGDYAGFAQLELEKRHPGAAALFLQGCGADQNPLPRRTVQLAQQYGQELAAAVDRVLDEDMQQLAPHLATAYNEIDLPLNPPPNKEQLMKKAATLTDYQKRWAENLIKRIDRGEALRTSYPYPVEVWNLGNQPVVYLGGEVVVDYAIEIKRILGQHTFVLGYSNDVMSYIPSARILEEGGYEGESSQMVYGLPNTWRSDIESLIVQEVLHTAKQAGLPIPFKTSLTATSEK